MHVVNSFWGGCIIFIDENFSVLCIVIVFLEILYLFVAMCLTILDKQP